MKKFLVTSLKQVSALAAKANEEAEKKRIQKLRVKQRLVKQAAEKIIEEERRKAIRAENERLQIIELRKRVRAVYHSLASAAWQGRNFVAISEDCLSYSSELSRYGLRLVSYLDLVEFLNGTQGNLLNELRDLLRVYSSDGFALNQKIVQLCLGIEKNGLAWYVKNQQDILEEIDAVEADIYQRRGEALNQIESLLAKAQQDKVGRVRAIEADIARYETELEKCLGAVKHLESIARQLSSFTSKIANDLAISYPDDVYISLANRVSFLRGAYSNIIPQHDFSRYSDLEILNIVRLANGVDAFFVIEEAHRQTSIGGNGAPLRMTTLRAKLTALNDALSAATSISRSHVQEPISPQLVSAKERYVRIGECHNIYRRRAARIRDLYAGACKQFDFYSPRELFYRKAYYANIVLAELDPSPNNLHPDVVIAYEELDWLSGRSGRMYLSKIERLLRSVAESASTSVEVTVRAKGGSKSTVELLGELLSASIRPALVLLMFKLAGLKVSSAFHGHDEVVVVFSW